MIHMFEWAIMELITTWHLDYPPPNLETNPIFKENKSLSSTNGLADELSSSHDLKVLDDC